MNKIEKLKIVFSCILFAFSFLGLIGAVSYLLDRNEWFSYAYATFGSVDGGASNSPILFGLSAIAGAILLATVRNENRQ